MNIARRYNIFWSTLYCDASFSKEHGGAWSIWLRSEKGRIVRSGKCPPEIYNSLLAEFFAAYQGVAIARSEWETDGVQINSDCLAVVDGLGSGYRWSSNKDVRKIQDKILRLGATLRTKHVKAHTGLSDTRSYLNRKCDKFANIARKSQ